MALIKPFRAVRPRQDLAHLIAALPYDVMDSAEAKEMVKGNEYSFLRIDRAEINFPDLPDPHEDRVYAKAGEIFRRMLKQGQFIQDEKDCFYIYRQIMEGRTQTGLVCGTSIDDYEQDVIKKHEFTRPDKEVDRINHIKALNAQSGPIFQTYPEQPAITAIINEWANSRKPVYQFTANDVEQMVWVIDEQAVVQKIVELFAQVDHLYIADGHHRSSAAVQVGMELRKQNPQAPAHAEFNFFLAVLFPASDLKIWPYNRLVADLAGISPEEFLKRVGEHFTVEPAPASPFEPQTKHTFGMYLHGRWYKLTAKPEIIHDSDPVRGLDAAILQENLLSPILHIKDPRTDARIDFVGGIRGVGELEQRVREGMAVAFSMYPTAISDVLRVADSGKVMPPKSTWFEPKLLSGLFIHKLED